MDGFFLERLLPAKRKSDHKVKDKHEDNNVKNMYVTDGRGDFSIVRLFFLLTAGHFCTRHQ